MSYPFMFKHRENPYTNTSYIEEKDFGLLLGGGRHGASCFGSSRYKGGRGSEPVFQGG